MTIERVYEKLTINACGPSAIDAYLGEGLDGPHVPKVLYNLAHHDDGIKSIALLKSLGGNIVANVDVDDWIENIDLRKRKIIFNNGSLQISATLPDLDTEFVSRLLDMKDKWNKKDLKHFVVLQLAARLARANQFGVLLRTVNVWNNGHVKYFRMGEGGCADAVVVFDHYHLWSDHIFGGIYLFGQDDYLPNRATKMSLRQIMYFPDHGRVSRAELVFFELDKNSPFLERGKP